MKKLLIPLIAAFAAIPFLFNVHGASSSPITSAASPTAAEHGFNADGPVRRAIRSAVKHFIAFRDETPLTNEQRDKVRETLAAHRAELKTQLAESRDAHRAMHQAVSQPDQNPAEVNAAAARVGEAARKGALLRASLAKEIRPILTAGQRSRIDAAIADVQEKTGEAIDSL